MFTGWYCHIASFFTTKCHEDNVTFLAANKAKDCTGNIAQVLLGEPHVLTSDTASEAAAPTNKEDSVLQAPRFCWVGEHQLFIMCFKAFDLLLNLHLLWIYHWHKIPEQLHFLFTGWLNMSSLIPQVSNWSHCMPTSQISDSYLGFDAPEQFASDPQFNYQRF